MVYRRSRDAIAFYGGDVHLILFRPHAGVGNYSAWGFHLRLRADGRWHHLLCKAGMRLPTNPDGRQHEIAVWRSVRPTSGRGRRRGERIGRKAYVRLRTSRHRHRGGAASA